MIELLKLQVFALARIDKGITRDHQLIYNYLLLASLFGNELFVL
jgi:hypothetical protein